MNGTGEYRHDCGWYRHYTDNPTKIEHAIWGSVTPARAAQLDNLNHVCQDYREALEKAQLAVGRYNDARDASLDRRRRDLADIEGGSSEGMESQRLQEFLRGSQLSHSEDDSSTGEGGPRVLVISGGVSDAGSDADNSAS